MVRFRHIPALVLLAAACVVPSGCAWMRNHFGPRDPFAANAPCAIPPNADPTTVVEYLNANTAKIPSWRSDNVKIRGTGAVETRIPIDALLAIEAPRNFRLVAKSPIGVSEEVDMGSNSEQFWYWVRQSEPKYVFVAYHQEESIERQRIPIPFDPEWVMEVFGVMPIDGSQMTAEPGPPNSYTLRLISYRMSPSGEQVRKEIVVDTCKGIIREHAVYDLNDRLLASAKLSGYVRDRTTQAVIPTRVELLWPKRSQRGGPDADMGLTMEMQRIEVRPQVLPANLWNVPQKTGYPVYDLNRDRSPGR